MSGNNFQPQEQQNPTQQPQQFQQPAQMSTQQPEVHQPQPQFQAYGQPGYVPHQPQPPQVQQFQQPAVGQDALAYAWPASGAERPTVAQQSGAPEWQGVPVQQGGYAPSQQWAPAQQSYVPGAFPAGMHGYAAMPGCPGMMPEQAKPKKSRKGLIIGLVTAVVLIAAALLVFFLVLKPMWFGSDSTQEFVTGLNDKPTVKSIAHSSGAISSGATDGVVVYSSGDEVWAVDPLTDKELWRESAEDLGCEGEDALQFKSGPGANGHLIFLCANHLGHKYGGLDVHTGERVGDLLQDDDVQFVKLLKNGILIVATGDPDATALAYTAYSDITRSEVLWTSDGYSSELYHFYDDFITGDERYWNTQTGERLNWLEDISSERNSYIISLSNGSVLIFDFENEELELRKLNGESIWKRTDINELLFPAYRHVFVEISGEKKALNIATGKEISFKIPEDLRDLEYSFPWEQGIIFGNDEELTAYTPEGKAWSLDTSDIGILQDGQYLYTVDDNDIIDGVLVNE